MAYYILEGTRYSPTIPLSGAGDQIYCSSVYWDSTLNGGNIEIETSVYTEINLGSGEYYWTDWEVVENPGDPIPSTDNEKSTTFMKCRQTLSALDHEQTPILHNLVININHYLFNNLLESDASDILVTKEDGLTRVPMELAFSEPHWLRGELYFRAEFISNTYNDPANNYYIYWSGSTPPSGERVWKNNALLIQHYNETSGTTINDSSEYNNDGNTVNSPELNWDRRIYDIDEEHGDRFYYGGKLGRSIDLSNGNDYVEVPASDTVLAPDYLRISTWISVDGINDYDTIVGKGWVGEGYSLRLFSDGSVRFSIHDEDPTADWTEAIAPAGSIKTNDWTYDSEISSYHLKPEDEYWHKITGQYDGTNLELYIDGKSTATISASGITRAKKDQNIGIGVEPGDSYSRFFDGRIDEVRIFDDIKSLEWEETEYINENTPTEFYSIDIFENIHDRYPYLTFE